MKTVIIVQARMGSTRLPGKVMKKIVGIPMIGIILKRLKKSKEADEVIVATSNNKENKILLEYLKKNKASYFCGSEKDVLNRFYKAASKYKAKIIVRITADCPLVDIKIVDEFIKKFKKKKTDYLSNCLPWTYPDGLDVEVFSYELLTKVEKRATKSQREKEGVIISYLIDNPESVNSVNISCPIKKLPKYRWTVDEEVDLFLIRKIYENFSPNIYFGFKEIIKFAKKNKKLFKINSMIKLNEGSNLNKGQKLWRRANTIILGGNSLLSKNPNLFLPNKWPTYFTRSKGCKVWDLNNKPYTDMSLMGVGTNILGYCNNQVDNAVKKVIKKGNLTTLNCPEEVFLAEKLLSMHPWAGKVKFARTGGEANAMAIRIARAAAGRDKIAICGYHGWHDWYLAANLKNKNNLKKHLLAGLEPIGVPRILKETIIPFEYNNFDQIKSIVEKDSKIGTIKLEVARNSEPKNNFLKKIRELADKKKIVLIFDECTSGFRETYGGLHKKYQVFPDLVIYGKALGNGYAITTVVGKRNVMDYAKNSFISSTFWTERIGPTAAIESLKIMHKIKSWEIITKIGKQIIKNWIELAKKNNLRINISGISALPNFNFNNKNLEYKTLITQEMLKKGFLASNSIYVCTEHKTNIIEAYMENLDNVFKIINQCENENRNIYDLLDGPVCNDNFKKSN